MRFLALVFYYVMKFLDATVLLCRLHIWKLFPKMSTLQEMWKYICQASKCLGVSDKAFCESFAFRNLWSLYPKYADFLKILLQRRAWIRETLNFHCTIIRILRCVTFATVAREETFIFLTAILLQLKFIKS